jgi:hypothetical protein
LSLAGKKSPSSACQPEKRRTAMRITENITCNEDLLLVEIRLIFLKVMNLIICDFDSPTLFLDLKIFTFGMETVRRLNIKKIIRTPYEAASSRRKCPGSDRAVEVKFPRYGIIVRSLRRWGI